MVWDKWIYDELIELAQKTETEVDDKILEKVDELIDELGDNMI